MTGLSERKPKIFLRTLWGRGKTRTQNVTICTTSQILGNDKWVNACLGREQHKGQRVAEGWSVITHRIGGNRFTR
jgi:hypothetical protein